MGSVYQQMFPGACLHDEEMLLLAYETRGEENISLSFISDIHESTVHSKHMGIWTREIPTYICKQK